MRRLGFALFACVAVEMHVAALVGAGQSAAGVRRGHHRRRRRRRLRDGKAGSETDGGRRTALAALWEPDGPALAALARSLACWTRAAGPVRARRQAVVYDGGLAMQAPGVRGERALLLGLLLGASQAAGRGVRRAAWAGEGREGRQVPGGVVRVCLSGCLSVCLCLCLYVCVWPACLCLACLSVSGLCLACLSVSGRSGLSVPVSVPVSVSCLCRSVSR